MTAQQGATLQRWLRDQNLPRSRRHVALQYFSNLYKNQFNETDGILGQMPPNMRDEFAQHLYKQVRGTAGI